MATIEEVTKALKAKLRKDWDDDGGNEAGFNQAWADGQDVKTAAAAREVVAGADPAEGDPNWGETISSEDWIQKKKELGIY